ncbi:hypothetical protein ACFY2R_19685 [Micromonospora olivasterospora]|uniref:Uncharacterized protein n=1 Tax=Micromonospora olivasterospora TaxID=1880 RepID=A0A562IGV6_MICOL|nr:hypothetical protein [Micromonospora olivasterospora]TWH69983.1 hypothetical protein JD77_05001 [Micromonospora olivasterospora]
MTDASSGKASPQDGPPRWVDRGRQLARRAGPRAVTVLRTSWARLLPLLRRVRGAMEGSRASPPPDEIFEHREPSGPISVAAKGHVFTFTVRAVFTWSAAGLGPEALIWYARHFMPAAVQRLRRAAAERARHVAPHRAGQLEAALQAALDEETPWRYDRAGVTVRCRVEVAVRHDDRVRQALRPHWERLIELEHQYEFYLKRARYAEQLSRRWMAILDEMVDDPAGGEEARTVDEELSRARRHMAAEQRAAARWTGDLLRDRRRFDGIFEPLTAIDIVPPQASSPARGTSGPAAQATSTESGSTT